MQAWHDGGSPRKSPDGVAGMIRSHRIALDVNTGQRVALARHAGYARFAYNWALADFKAGLDAGEWRSDRTLRPRWNAAKPAAAPWCTALLQVVAKNAIRDLGRATDNWKNPKLRARFPRFKRRGGRQSFRLDNGPDTVRIAGRRLHAGKLGTFRMREALRFEGRILGAVVSRTAQRWFVSVTVEDGVDLPVEHEAVGAIGVDVGIKTLAACSDGVTYPNPKAHEAACAKLRRTQKAVARSRNANRGKPCSNRRRRRMGRLARIHARAANVRSDAHHKASTAIVARARATICAVVTEDLNARAMVRNRRLSRALSDAALGGFVAMLACKCVHASVPFHQADRWYPSTKTCSGCGAVQSVPLNVRTYRCACGLSLDRDINAARNLANLVAGSSPETVNGRGERVSRALPAVLCEASTRAEIAPHLVRSCQT